MNDLIEALQILAKYDPNDYPTHCEHDVLCVFVADPMAVSDVDIVRLDQLGFDRGEPDASGGEVCFYSYRFGSA